MPRVGVGLGSTWVEVGTGDWVAVKLGSGWVVGGSVDWTAKVDFDICGTVVLAYQHLSKERWPGAFGSRLPAG
jgi:hypothetical protein